MKLSDITSRILSEVGAAIQRAARTEARRPSETVEDAPPRRRQATEPEPETPRPRRGRPQTIPDDVSGLRDLVARQGRQIAELRDLVHVVTKENAQLAAKLEAGVEGFFPELQTQLRDLIGDFNRLTSQQRESVKELSELQNELQQFEDELESEDQDESQSEDEGSGS